MLGGVTVNFILAAIIYIILAFVYGSTEIDAKSVRDGYAINNPVFETIGLKTGDNILAINGREITYVSDIRKQFLTAKTMTIERGGQSQILEFPVDFLGQLSSSKTKDLPEIRCPFIFDNPIEGSLNSDVDIMAGDLLLSIDGSPARSLADGAPINYHRAVL